MPWTLEIIGPFETMWTVGLEFTHGFERRVPSLFPGGARTGLRRTGRAP